jgi:hypothetical protein
VDIKRLIRGAIPRAVWHKLFCGAVMIEERGFGTYRKGSREIVTVPVARIKCRKCGYKKYMPIGD